MSALFPYANILTGFLLLVIGFGFHWLGQLISVLNWELARRLGLQENMPSEYRVYEHGIAVADSILGLVYGPVAIGLMLNAEWAYALAWIPGSVLVYHAISAWVWEANRRSAGHGLWSDVMRTSWVSANFVTGILTMLVAWAGQTGG